MNNFEIGDIVYVKVIKDKMTYWGYSGGIIGIINEVGPIEGSQNNSKWCNLTIPEIEDQEPYLHNYSHWTEHDLVLLKRNPKATHIQIWQLETIEDFNQYIIETLKSN